MMLQIQFYTPTNEILKQYIEGYYFICDDQSEGKIKYLTFPNNYCIVTSNLNSSVILDKNKITILPSTIKNVYTSLVYRYVDPIEVYYEKPINEITIYFKPLGLNQFINDSNLNNMFSQNDMIEFAPSLPDFKQTMHTIFHIKDRNTQIKMLDDYWLSKLMIKDLDTVKLILSDIESNMKIEEIAKKHHISRKHLNKIILKHLGKSPTEYRKIYRFRSAIGNKKGLKNLTELSYENLFYDQSHLIKDFKTLTKINPNTFFKNINTENKNIWLFI